jgi:hypothetical protein
MLRTRWWQWLGILLGSLLLGWLALAQLDRWRARGELVLARQEIAQGKLKVARRRLTAITAYPGALGNAAHYWLGLCEALSARPEAALDAFACLPESYPFDPAGRYHEAKANLALGRVHAAERRLEQVVARGGQGLDGLRSLLSHIYQLELRFDDVRPLLQISLAEADDPINTLKELSNFDLPRLPYDGLEAALEQAGQSAPQDPRVWLGKARLALEAARWDEAESWLRRCRQAGADAPVWRSWIDWARGTRQPREALEAARYLDQKQLDPAARIALAAWVYQQEGDVKAEASALEHWLQLEPTATLAMERGAELAHRSGAHERVAEFRRRKAGVEQAMASYRHLLWQEAPPRTAVERSEMARLAEAAGRRHEARALYAWALKADPHDPRAVEGLARLEWSDSRRQQLALTAISDSWPEPKPAAHPAVAGQHARSQVGLAFTDLAGDVGLHFVYDNAETPIHQLPEPFGGGVAILDFDNDGWLDVYCVGGGPFDTPPIASHAQDSPGKSGDRLFHNRGNGTFEDVTDRSAISRFPRGHGHGVTVGDIDGDGYVDLFVTRWRSYAFYRNQGDGTFADVTDSWGLGGRRDWPTSAVLADLDGDGDLDLYVCHYAVWDLSNPRICRHPKTQAYLNCSPLDALALPDHLFRNDGGRFVDITRESGITDRDGRGLGVAAADFDGDGRLDLFVANDSSANFLFRNLGGMHFEEVGHLAGVAANTSGSYQAGMGVAAGDLDGDGLIDLAVTNFYGESTTFFRNLGGGVFTDATASIGLASASRRLLGFGLGLLDVNNDGHLDLASANGHVNDLRPNYPYLMPAQLLLGRADGRLVDVSNRAGAVWQVPRMGRGLAVGDLDNDGREDVLIVSHNQPLAYLHNRTQGGRFLTLRLVGRHPGGDAIGAKVIVIASGRRHVAWRVGGGSYQSASDPRIHFGLGDADRIELLDVTWPTGHVDRLRGLRTDAGYTLREGRAEPEPLQGFREAAPES